MTKKTEPLKIIFAGTPAFAVPTLQALIDSPHQVIMVYTQPDRPAGRHQQLTESPIKQLAKKHLIPVHQPATFKDEKEKASLRALGADIMVVVAYGLILPKDILTSPRHGCFNIHASLLPRWRGASPIHRAIEAGDKETGITIMQIEPALDSGPILKQSKLPIAPTETTASLHDKLTSLGATLLMETLDDLQNDCLKPEAQDENHITFTGKIKKTDADIQWQTPAINIERKIRAYNAWPVCYTTLEETTIRVWGSQLSKTTSSETPGTIVDVNDNGIVVATSAGCLCLTELQFPGKKVLPVSEILKSRRDFLSPGKVFHDSKK